MSQGTYTYALEETGWVNRHRTVVRTWIEDLGVIGVARKKGLNPHRLRVALARNGMVDLVPTIAQLHKDPVSAARVFDTAENMTVASARLGVSEPYAWVYYHAFIAPKRFAPLCNESITWAELKNGLSQIQEPTLISSRRESYVIMPAADYQKLKEQAT